MKNVKIYSVMFCLMSFFACEKNEVEEVKMRQFVDLKFEAGSSVNGRSQTLIVNDVEIKDGMLVSTLLLTEVAKHGGTNKNVYVYLYVDDEEVAGINTNLRAKTRRAWIFNGRCLEYGTVVSDNGVEIFFPASVHTKAMGFADICPPDGSEWAFKIPPTEIEPIESDPNRVDIFKN